MPGKGKNIYSMRYLFFFRRTALVREMVDTRVTYYVYRIRRTFKALTVKGRYEIYGINKNRLPRDRFEGRGKGEGEEKNKKIKLIPLVKYSFERKRQQSR